MKDTLTLMFLAIILLSIILIATRQINSFVDMKSDSHSNFIKRQLGQFGNIPISLIAAKNQGKLGLSADAMLRTPGIKTSFPVNKKDGLWEITEKCESIKAMDCSAFDDPAFSLNCGICLDVGKTHDSVSTTGGLVLLPADKEAARSARQSDLIPEYVPTIGFCPAKKMVSTKEECVKLQRQLLCKKNGSFDITGCSLCLSTGSYGIIDEKLSPGIISGYGRILVIGKGILTISEDGVDPRAGIKLSETKAYAFDIRATEGNHITFTVQPPSDSTEEAPIMPYMAGYIVGRTYNGEWTQDLRSLIKVDSVTTRKPRTGGIGKINGINVTKMAPAFGQTTMNLVSIIPFTFIESTMQEAGLCKGSPFITKQSSAEFLNSDPCFNKTSAPGQYSLECLQAVWISNGGTQSGKGYPKDAVTAGLLMTNPNGSLRTINDISNFIYNNSIIAATGRNIDGNKVSLKVWSDMSEATIGKAITSPCDTPLANSGPLSEDCIVYLWTNEGFARMSNGSPSPIGPTYYSTENTTMPAQGSIPRGCLDTGSLSPVGASKKLGLQYWQSKGGVENVKRMMADLHRAANLQMESEDELSPFFTQCYGVSLSTGPLPESKGCNEYVLIKNMDLPAYNPNDNIKNVGTNLSPYELTQFCDNTPGCKGVNSGGWLKRTVYKYSKLAPVDYWRNDPNGGVYIKISEASGKIPRNYWQTPNCTPPPPPPPPICKDGYTWNKLGDFKLGYIDTRIDYNLGKPEYKSPGWFFTANRNNWHRVAAGQQNETWSSVYFSGSDINGISVFKVFDKSEIVKKYNIKNTYPTTHPRNGVWVNYLLKHPTQNSYVTLMRNTIPLLLDWGHTKAAAIVGEYKGNNQPDQATLVDQVGPYAGTPLMGEIYELYFASSSDRC